MVVVKYAHNYLSVLPVLPEYRGKGITSALICKALKIIKQSAEFATVSDECDNSTNPEGVYRKCGFGAMTFGIAYHIRNN